MENTTKTEIDFVDDWGGPRKSQSHWLQRTKEILEAMKVHKDYDSLAKATGLKPAYLKMIVGEIRKAKRANYASLEDYFAADRPFGYGKKVVAKTK